MRLRFTSVLQVSLVEAEQDIYSVVFAHLLPQGQQSDSLVTTNFSPKFFELEERADSLVLVTATHLVHSPKTETHIRQDNLPVSLKPFQGQLL